LEHVTPNGRNSMETLTDLQAEGIRESGMPNRILFVIDNAEYGKQSYSVETVIADYNANERTEGDDWTVADIRYRDAVVHDDLLVVALALVKDDED
jgi:hypothetical protein